MVRTDRRPPLPRAAAVVFAAVAAMASVAGCSNPPRDPIQLDRGLLTLDNRSGQAWSNVEVWINGYYRLTAPTLPPDGRFQASLDSAVSGFGQRFDFNRMQVKELRVVARLPDGKPLELKKKFAASGLAGALGGTR